MARKKRRDIEQVKHIGDRIDQGEFTSLYRKDLTDKKSLSFTRNSIYPIFAYLFNMNHITLYDHYDYVNFDDVITRMMEYCGSLISDFYEESRFLPWMRKNALFFQHAFLTSNLFVHWDGTEEEYELYVCIGKEYNKDHEHYQKPKFLNIETNRTVTFSDPDEMLVKFSWNGREEKRFASWFKFAYHMEVKLAIFHIQCLLFNKRVLLKGENHINANQAALQQLQKELKNLAPYVNKTDRQSLLAFLEQPIQSAAEIDLYLTCVYKFYDRETANKGMVANLNPKKARNTTGDFYMALDKHTDDMRARLDQLDLMTIEMEERGWPPLVFKLNSDVSIGAEPDPEEVGEEGEGAPMPSA